MISDALVGGNGRAALGERPRGFSRAALDAFSSVWFGVILASLLFIYCSLGSAFPQVRQLPVLEMTEFEWFHWWPFNTLIIVFCLSLIISTFRRIPFRVINLGVWTIHAGIIVLAIGSYWYFGTKIEGDAPVFRRRLNVKLPGLVEPRHLVALHGSRAEVVAGPDVWRFEVADTNTSWPILSDDHKGETAFAVNVKVTPPTGEPFIRQLLDGYPQYTEDVIPGKGRAIKATGRKLVDENLQLTLDYEPQKHFHLQDTWALFVRKVGQREWVERPIDGLPRYNNRIAARDQVFSDPSDPQTIRPIDLDVPPSSAGDALSTASMRITGYLRYARLDQQWREGGDRLNPVLRITALAEGMNEREYELVAFDAKQSLAGDGAVQFLWLPNASQLAGLPSDPSASLHLAVPAANVSLDVPITEQSVGGEFLSIRGTDFSYRILGLNDNLGLPGADRSVSIAVVEIKTPEGGIIRRWVADQPERTRDIQSGDDPHRSTAGAPDSRLEMSYRPQSAPLIFAAYPGGLHFRFNGPGTLRVDRAVKPGEVIDITAGLRIRVDELFARAVAEIKPYIVPPTARQSKAGETFSMIRLEVSGGRSRQAEWIPYSPYAFESEEYAANRFAFNPVRFRMDDGAEVEVLFSRQRESLPAEIALDRFDLDTHLGGYTGSASTIRNYISHLRFRDGKEWSAPAEIAVNHPAQFAGLSYFQSTWDAPDERNLGSGMCYTGLGIGNRHGVAVQLAGCCMAVVGMFFAFYVKPWIRRRRLESGAWRGETPMPRELGVVAEACEEVRTA